jgi:quercetin dioxygenase-like cupin family protein
VQRTIQAATLQTVFGRPLYEGEQMFTVALDQLQPFEDWGQENPHHRFKADFPIFGGVGATNSVVVYVEIEPGMALGRHTDSEEEVILILQGVAEVSVGTERAILSSGQMVVAPKMEPHSLRNVGQETVKMVGFFGGGRVISTFDEVYAASGMRRFDTADLLAA